MTHQQTAFGNDPHVRHAVLVVRDRNPELRAEFKQLTKSCDFVARAELSAPREAHPQNYLGGGKLQQLCESARAHGVKLVLIDALLSPTQARNLERVTQCEILDRTDVILKIFALHARTYEAKLQVERAQLERQSTRLTRRWMHLERQRGGIGVRGGPGEAQLESDKRKLRHECRQLDKRLQRVRSARQLSRANRHKARVPLVVLVGRTNAGKSTLFNALSDAGAVVANRMFATLGTTLRRVNCHGVEFVLADTVGFIRNLPHELVESFHATLEEVCQADLLLQLTDISNEHWRSEAHAVREVLVQIGASSVPCINVFTKSDALDDANSGSTYRNAFGQLERLYVSAHTGAGLDLLRHAIAEYLRGSMCRHTLSLDARQGVLQAELHRRGVVLSERARVSGGWQMDIMLPKQEWQQLQNRYLL